MPRDSVDRSDHLTGGLAGPGPLRPLPAPGPPGLPSGGPVPLAGKKILCSSPPGDQETGVHLQPPSGSGEGRLPGALRPTGRARLRLRARQLVPLPSRVHQLLVRRGHEHPGDRCSADPSMWRWWPTRSAGDECLPHPGGVLPGGPPLCHVVLPTAGGPTPVEPPPPPA